MSIPKIFTQFIDSPLGFDVPIFGNKVITEIPSPSPTPSPIPPTPSASASPTPTPTPSATPPAFNGFIIEVDTTKTGSPSNEIRLPIEITNGTIDWGDGNIDTGVNGTISSTIDHVYSTGGVYDIKISNDITRIRFNFSGDRRKLIDIKQWGNCEWSSFERAFFGCINLNSTATDVPDLSNLTDMSVMFRQTSFNSPIGNWDVGNVTNMNNMFWETPFNQDISGWDVSNVTNMESMFSKSPFNQDISGWNVSGVTTMQSMFSESQFNQNIGNWDVSSLTNITNMFRISPFNQDISSWNVSGVTIMLSTFRDTPFNQDISGWNVSNVTNMRGMFRETPFNQNIGNWNISSVTDMREMFLDATSFNQDLGSWELRTAGVNMANMFDNSGLSVENYSRTLIGWANYVDVKNDLPANITLGADGMDYDCVDYITGTTYTNAVSARDYLVNGTPDWTITGDNEIAPCPTPTPSASAIPPTPTPSTSSIPPTPTPSTSAIPPTPTPSSTPAPSFNGFILEVDTTQPGSPSDEIKLPIDITNGTIDWGDGIVETGITSTISSTTDHVYLSGGTYEIKISEELTRIQIAFSGDRQKLIDIKQWGDCLWSSFDNAFNGCNNLNVSATDAPDFSNATSLASMFNNCNIFNGSIGHWDMSNIENINTMLRATNFNQDISGWDVSNIKQMNGVFIFAPFNQDISGWDVTSVENMSEMFLLSSFNQDLGDWELRTAGVSLNSMFDGCAMSVENYSKTLIGWANYVDAKGDIPANLTLGASGLKYDDVQREVGGVYDNAVDARDYLVNGTPNWTINDDGQDT